MGLVGRTGFTRGAAGHAAVMDLKRPLVALALAGALAGCSSAGTGGNTDLDRGTTECGAAEAGSTDEEVCQDTEQDNEQQTDEEDDGEG